MSAPETGDAGDEDDEESSEGVSAAEALAMLPDEDEFETEF